MPSNLILGSQFWTPPAVQRPGSPAGPDQPAPPSAAGPPVRPTAPAPRGSSCSSLTAAYRRRLATRQSRQGAPGRAGTGLLRHCDRHGITRAAAPSSPPALPQPQPAPHCPQRGGPAAIRKDADKLGCVTWTTAGHAHPPSQAVPRRCASLPPRRGSRGLARPDSDSERPHATHRVQSPDRTRMALNRAHRPTAGA